MPSTPPPAAQETLLRRLFEQAPGFVAILQGPQHVFLLANPAYFRLVGDRDVIGKTVHEAIPEAASHGFIEVLDRVFASGEAFVGHRLPIALSRVPGAPAEQRFVDFVYQPVLDPRGRVEGIFCQGHDVTGQVATERSLLDEAERRAAQSRVFDTVLSSIEDFAYTFDAGGRFVYSNKPLLDLLGIRLQDIVGKTFLELPYPAELAERLHAEIQEVFETGRQVRRETFYESPTGACGWYEYIFNPVFGADGRVETVAGSTRDITLRRDQERRLAALNESERAARAEAERASRLKDEFLATLSHELRTPLNAIQGWGDLLRSGRLVGEQVKDAGERISRNSRAQGQLIADLLDMNGIVAGKVRLTIERLPLAKPLQAAIDAVRMEAAKKGVTLRAPSFDATLQIDCDPDRLQQVFWNLLTNAVKFTPHGGTVSVDVDMEAGSDSVTVVVADSGVGVSPEFLPHLFQRFTQADNSATRRQGGLGLGLSICKSLVEMHRGRIAAASEGIGKGTSFSVSLPLEQQHPDGIPESTWGNLSEGEMPAADEALSIDGARILVVDDDEEGRHVVTTVLRQYGASVSVAGNADEAFDKLQSESPDLILCDIGMPVIDGYQLLWRIRKHSSVPAIALTAMARPEDRKKAFESGFVAHIPKPAAPATTIRTCAEVLGRLGCSTGP